MPWEKGLVYWKDVASCRTVAAVLYIHTTKHTSFISAVIFCENLLAHCTPAHLGVMGGREQWLVGYNCFNCIIPFPSMHTFLSRYPAYNTSSLIDSAVGSLLISSLLPASETYENCSFNIIAFGSVSVWWWQAEKREWDRERGAQRM